MKWFTLLLIPFSIVSGLEVLSYTDILIDQTVRLTDQEFEKYIDVKDGTEHISGEKFKKINAKFCDRSHLSSGGSQTITFKALSTLGCKCKVIGTMGKDIWGQRYLELMASSGIAVSPIYTTTTTGHCFCFPDGEGNRSMMTYLGAALDLKKEHIDETHFEHTDLYLASAYSIFNKECLLRTLQCAKLHGAKIALDLGSYNLVEKFRDELLELIDKYVDVVFANQEEATALTRLQNGPAATLSLARHCKIAVVHMGAEGGLIANRDGLYQYNAIPVKKVVDTTCAGDLFAAGFLYGYLNDMKVKEAALYGAALGGAIVEVNGSTLPDQVLGDIHGYVKKQSDHFLFGHYSD